MAIACRTGRNRICVVREFLMILGNERGIPRNIREIWIKGRWVDGKTLPRWRSVRFR